MYHRQLQPEVDVFIGGPSFPPARIIFHKMANDSVEYDTAETQEPTLKFKRQTLFRRDHISPHPGVTHPRPHYPANGDRTPPAKTAIKCPSTAFLLSPAYFRSLLIFRLFINHTFSSSPAEEDLRVEIF